ncbi:hypothetical protein Cantr_05540 [Candida viswanathii]|uniref:Uncharacterized protein n=1 Tax=Candida viswanathii TaxID=5486 RepID=A0A367XRD1_9ASCO|nr:hypothetical protein Cantr_05540 [Candida viswanathii]
MSSVKVASSTTTKDTSSNHESFNERCKRTQENLEDKWDDLPVKVQHCFEKFGKGTKKTFHWSKHD